MWTFLLWKWSRVSFHVLCKGRIIPSGWMQDIKIMVSALLHDFSQICLLAQTQDAWSICWIVSHRLWSIHYSLKSRWNVHMFRWGIGMGRGEDELNVSFQSATCICKSTDSSITAMYSWPPKSVARWFLTKKLSHFLMDFNYIDVSCCAHLFEVYISADRQR